MRAKKWLGVFLSAAIVTQAGYLAYASVQRHYGHDFTCVANFSQHFSGETYSVLINYMLRGENGVINMTGRSEENPGMTFNRKIAFTLQRKGDLYYMVSEKNIKLPDDNVSDEALSKHEPQFFVYPGKEIYMRIMKQQNGNFLFMVESIPTYVCKNVTNKI